MSYAIKATQDGQVMVENFNKMWPTGEGNGKPLQHSCLENPMNSVKWKNKRYDTERWITRSEVTQYTTGEEWKNSFRRNEEAEPSGNNAQLWICQVEKVVWSSKEQHCIGTRDVRSMSQGKLEVVKQEMKRVKIEILGISELK